MPLGEPASLVVYVGLLLLASAAMPTSWLHQGMPLNISLSQPAFREVELGASPIQFLKLGAAAYIIH